MMKKVRKAWNGGSIESAMEYAKQQRDKMIEQGATLCDECGGEGGNVAAGVCQQCHGAGCVLPAEGLRIQSEVEKLRALAFELSPSEQFRLAFFIAENIGHILTADKTADLFASRFDALEDALKSQLEASVILMDRLGFDEVTKSDCTAQARLALAAVGNIRTLR